MKILVIEDEKFIRDSITNLLKKNGYSVVEADNPQTAIELIETEKLGLIISDLMLPYAGGFDILEHVKGNPETKNIPVILVTGMDEEILDSTRNDADFCIKKPFTTEELSEKVRHFFPQPAVS